MAPIVFMIVAVAAFVLGATCMFLDGCLKRFCQKAKRELGAAAESGAEIPPRLDSQRDPSLEAEMKKWLIGKPCRACGGTEHVECHHKWPVHLYPERQHDPQYWVPLCMAPTRRCHWSFGHLCRSWSWFNENVEEDSDKRLAELQAAEKRAA